MYLNIAEPVNKEHHLHELFQSVVDVLNEWLSKLRPQTIRVATRRLHAIAHLLEHCLGV